MGNPVASLRALKKKDALLQKGIYGCQALILCFIHWLKAGPLRKKGGALISKQAEHEEEEVKKMEEDANLKHIEQEVPARQKPGIPLLKSNSVSATKADDILSLDLISASSNSYHAHNHGKLQGHRLSTGDSPLNMQRRHGSHGPASLRTSLPSPGTPSRSSFSGVSSPFMLNKASHYSIAGRIAAIEGNGKLLALHNLTPCYQDHDAAHANGLTSGRLSVGFSSTAAAARAAPLPSKWDDAEKWLFNASPAHPSQALVYPSTSRYSANYALKQATCKNPHAGSKRSLPNVHKRVLYDAAVSPPGTSQYISQVDDGHLHLEGEQLAYSNAHSSKDYHLGSSDAAEHYIESRSLVPAAMEGHDDGGAMSDSELSNIQEEGRSAFARSSSHGQNTDVKHHGNRRKGQGHINDQLPAIHDVYAVETAMAAEAPREAAADVAGNGRLTRLVVQAGAVVGKWGAGAMRDASTDVSPKQSMSRRDMGTQMTPAPSSRTSPRKQRSQECQATSEATSEHRPVENGSHVAKTGSGHVGSTLGSDSCSSHEGGSSSTSSSWKSLQESLGFASDHHPLHTAAGAAQTLRKSNAETELTQKTPHDNPQYLAWEEAERSKHMTKCAREEARIDAWENHQKAKAEAELKKLEMKLERLRAQVTEKIVNKVATAHLRAEEMRVTARAQQVDQLAKALEKANSINKKNGGYFSESLGVCFSMMP